MKYLYVDTHSQFCKHQPQFGIDYCEQNPEHFLFFIKNQFVMIDYHCCMNGGNHIDWKREIIENLIENSKIFETYEIRKSVSVKESLKDFRIRNTPLKKWIYQVHYLYGSPAKQYCIASKVKFLDAICDNEKMHNNYIEAKQFLESGGKKYMLDELKELYFKNVLHDVNNAEICKTVEHLVDSINKLVK